MSGVLPRAGSGSVPTYRFRLTSASKEPPSVPKLSPAQVEKRLVDDMEERSRQFDARHSMGLVTPEDLWATYARVSTPQQVLEGQQREIEERVMELGGVVGARFFDRASARGRVTRKGFEEMWAAARSPEREWTHLIVWSLDRFSRNERFTKAIDEIYALEDLRIRFHSVKEPGLDTGPDFKDTLERAVLRGLLAPIATFESRRRSERNKLTSDELVSGRRATKSGKLPWRPPVLSQEVAEKIRKIKRRDPTITHHQMAVKVGVKAGTVAYFLSLDRRGLWKPRALERVRPSAGSSPPLESEPFPKGPA